MANEVLLNAKKEKQCEFYTQYEDIQREINAFLEFDPNTFRDKTVLLPCDDPEWSNFTKFFAQNFEMLGLKKLISTSYAVDSKKREYNFEYDNEYYRQMSLLEIQSAQYDEGKTKSRGRIFTLTKDTNNSGNVDYDDLEWNYLNGDGDFRSDEIKALRDEADIIVTNPPFFLFIDFMNWILEADKKFLVIGQIGMSTYKNLFPYIRDNKIWRGIPFLGGNAYFEIPKSFVREWADGVFDEKTGKVKFRNCCWYTNLDHGRRHAPLALMSMEDNLRYSRHKDIRENGYPHYYNYDGIDVPYVDAIPCDFDGVMGVPSSFLDNYNPEQFEIIGMGSGYLGQSIGVGNILKEHKRLMKGHSAAGDLYYLQKDGTPKVPYSRILIKRKREKK